MSARHFQVAIPLCMHTAALSLSYWLVTSRVNPLSKPHPLGTRSMVPLPTHRRVKPYRFLHNPGLIPNFPVTILSPSLLLFKWHNFFIHLLVQQSFPLTITTPCYPSQVLPRITRACCATTKSIHVSIHHPIVSNLPPQLRPYLTHFLPVLILYPYLLRLYAPQLVSLPQSLQTSNLYLIRICSWYQTPRTNFLTASLLLSFSVITPSFHINISCRRGINHPTRVFLIWFSGYLYLLDINNCLWSPTFDHFLLLSQAFSIFTNQVTIHPISHCSSLRVIQANCSISFTLHHGSHTGDI